MKLIYNVNLTAGDSSVSVITHKHYYFNGTSKSSNFFVSARKHRADDRMDAGGRAKQEARAENHSV